MDAGAIISATGGSLGLFLGISCFGVAWDVSNFIGAAVIKRGFPGFVHN